MQVFFLSKVANLQKVGNLITLHYMKKILVYCWYSLPVQLVLLHCRRYQVLLLFWYILFATVGGNFLSSYGSVALYLAPEYLGKVNFLSAAMVGMAVGIFIMSWNITTFILHSRLLHFLATTSQPFLKYCINNALLPIVFLGYYFTKAFQFEANQEFNDYQTILLLAVGLLSGIGLAIVIAFLYFFTADKSIYYSMSQGITKANKQYEAEIALEKTKELQPYHHPEFRVDCFLSAFLHLRIPKDVSHYSEELLASIFNRHHFAAVYAILVAFLFLLVVGYFSDAAYFQLPAAASITLLFAILIAVSGALSLLLKSWSIPLLVLVYTVFNYLYVNELFDPRNKVYGLDYPAKKNRPIYNDEKINALATPANMAADKQRFLQVLNNWKQQQRLEKPTLYIINVSGGGLRSATFAFNALQRIDSAMGGNLMKQTVLINGASGGMLGAAYYRALYYERLKGNRSIHLNNAEYANDISKDLLNPLFSSFVTRDILGPVQLLKQNGNTYIKDRGYAFEQQLNRNTNGMLNHPLGAYSEAEQKGILPTMLFNPVISRDGKKIMISTQSFRFLMKPMAGDESRLNHYQADAIDFNSFFGGQGCRQINLLSALRMNATFPYVLPNVWLPTNPIVDVVDAGLRDNYGQETSIRLIEHCKEWLQANTSHLVLIQIRDTPENSPTESGEGSSILSFFTNPLLFMQDNWFTMQHFYQQEQLEHLYADYGSQFSKVCFQYIPLKKEKFAGLSFHLTTAEKQDIAASLNDSSNREALKQLVGMGK